MLMLTRRQMLASTVIMASATTFGMRKKSHDYQYILAKADGVKANLPSDKYIPFDWGFSEISAGSEGVKLFWNQPKVSTKSGLRLRITSATDVREVVILAVRTAVTGKKIADWDIRFAHLLQPFDLEIPSEYIKDVLTEGVNLLMIEGTKPFWFFSGIREKSAPTAYLPHLLVYENPAEKDAWKDRLLSLESVQGFGWMQGVVLDGLLELSQHSNKAQRVLSEQLDLYFAQNSLVYCNLNNIKTIEKISTVESILPFAILAQTNPSHLLLETAIEFCKNQANSEGVIADGTGTNRMVKTEECYTVSYPLAVLAKTLNRPDLAQLAIQTLQVRVNVLEKGTNIYQRGTEQGELYFENWGRGVAWYLLGLAKTLTHLPDSDQKKTIQKSFQQSVEKVIACQQPGGLWFNFFHTPETGLETSGTAGIAAALTYGFKQGLLGENAGKAALKAQKGLLPFLTPDGYLTGTAQVNKGGDGLQRNGFRVISPYTLGFLAHFDRN